MIEEEKKECKEQVKQDVKEAAHIRQEAEVG